MLDQGGHEQEPPNIQTMRNSLTREELSQKQLQSKHHWAEVGVRKPANTPASTEVLLGHQG